MFGTIILEAYKQNEAEEVANALNDLCNPNDNYGWASAGVYSFWDYYTKEVYYIGLAVDLYERFKQHNGLTMIDSNCCKRLQLEEYFKINNKIGYTIFVQSPLSQPITHKNKATIEEVVRRNYIPIEDYTGNIGTEHMKYVEGILIETYRKKHGRYPLWNRMSGLKEGQNASKDGNYKIIEAINDTTLNPLVSRSTIRELSLNPTYEYYESHLHGARQLMLTFGSNFKDSLDIVNRFSQSLVYDQINKNRYFEKELIL